MTAVCAQRTAGADVPFTFQPRFHAQNAIFPTGEGYLVDLLATANGGIGCEGCVAVGNAGIDPYIWIDPSQAGQFSLLISAGVPNVPFPTGVPETSTWAMMLIGFAGLSFAYRRRLSLP
jgi:hypothetical protein